MSLVALHLDAQHVARNSRRRFQRSRQALLACIAAAVFAVVLPALPVSAITTAEVLESQFISQLNDERAARGIGPVTRNDSLDKAAWNWSNAMATNDSFKHSNDGRAEIIAVGWWTGQITDAWMRSPGHRHLMVDPNLVTAGVGVVCDAEGQLWATIQFVRADTSKPTQSSSSSTPRVTPADSGSSCDDGEAVGQVRRLYSAYFKRESDTSGLAHWVSELSGGTRLEQVSHSFASSREFINAYGNLSNRQFIRLVYVNVLGREPDNKGYDYWLSKLANGLSRGELMVGFSESGEFRRLTGIS